MFVLKMLSPSHITLQPEVPRSIQTCDHRKTDAVQADETNENKL